MTKLTYTVEVELDDEDGFWTAADVETELARKLENMFNAGFITDTWTITGGTA